MCIRDRLRLMKQAEKFGRPVICFIDTSGAFCGVGAEERGQGQAIAENLMEMTTLCVPVISILIGEGGSGGALALAVADRVWMLENAVYSVTVSYTHLDVYKRQVELLMSLEDEIGIEIELDQKVETVDDLDKFIQSKQG